MRLSMYLSLLFSISLVFYIAGYTPVGWQVLTMTSGGIFNIAPDGNIDDTIQPTEELVAENSGSVLLILFGTIMASVLVLSFVLGFSAIYIIPAILLFGILNFFVFPLGAILDLAMPDMLRVSIIFFYNFITVMAVITFIRGGN